MLSGLPLLRRRAGALRRAMREEGFGRVLAAAGPPIAIGTVSYSLGEDWSVVDALHFAVATPTTPSTADPELVLTRRWTKVFTVGYILVGIGILVEVVRRLGTAFVAVRSEHRAGRGGRGGAGTPSPRPRGCARAR